MKFSILDIETTGFSPRLGDRVIEVSIINTDLEGEITDTYETLVNPKRDVGPHWVHGITAEMVVDAPTFDEVYLDVLDAINDGVIVCHNARFDLRFLNHEMKKAGAEIGEFKGICTVDLSKGLLPGLPCYKLPVLCEYFDIEMKRAHSAFSDSWSTKLLFDELKTRYIDEFGYEDFLASLVEDFLRCYNLPRAETKKRQYKRTHAFQSREKRNNHLKEMLERLPNRNRSANLPVQEYLNILEEILADRIVTEEESEKLLALSEDYEISHEEAIDIHEEYLRRLARVYLLDRVITENEYADLIKVAKILGIEDKLALIIELEKANLSSFDSESAGRKEDIIGKSVCFTGQLNSTINGERIDRNWAQEIAMENGLKIKSGVSKKLDFLVVADPHTQSSKARKARELGVKIVAEPVFWKMVGVGVG